MSYSQAAICNLALGHLGMSATIDDFDADESTAGQACRTHYDLALDTLLRGWRWTFAEREVELAAVAGYDSQRWSYAYRAPSDFIRAWGINLSSVDEVGASYGMGGDASGQLILCDESEATLTYTARVTNTGLFPPAFVEVLAYALAIRLAQPLTAAEEYRAAAKSGYKAALHDALAQIGNEPTARPEGDGPFVEARDTLTEPDYGQ